MPANNSGDGRNQNQSQNTAQNQQSGGQNQQAGGQNQQAGGGAGGQNQQTQQARGQGNRRGMGEWFASSAVRVGLMLIGVIVLLFALGQAVNADLLGWTVEALTSEVGRWLVVAFFALLIIGAAQKGLTMRRH